MNKAHVVPIKAVVDSITITNSPYPVLVTGIAAFIAGASIITIVKNTMQEDMLNDELNYKESNEEQPKTYQKEINHTR